MLLDRYWSLGGRSSDPGLNQRSNPVLSNALASIGYYHLKFDKLPQLGQKVSSWK